MASKAKKGTPAPTSKKPVVRKDGQPTRAEKSAANKARYAVEGPAVRKAAHDIIVETRTEVQRAVGRPRDPEPEWTSDLEADLFALIVTGSSLRDISKIEGMPTLAQMLRWLADDTHKFSLCYARAKSAIVPLYEEDIQTIALTANEGEIRTEKQVVTKDGDVVDVVETRFVDNVERSKLAVNTLQWTLSHLKPKKHGRNAEPASNGPNEQLKGLFDALKAGPVD